MFEKQPLALDVWQTCSSKKHSVSIIDCGILEKNHINGTRGREASFMVFIHTHAGMLLVTLSSNMLANSSTFILFCHRIPAMTRHQITCIDSEFGPIFRITAAANLSQTLNVCTVELFTDTDYVKRRFLRQGVPMADI